MFHLEVYYIRSFLSVRTIFWLIYTGCGLSRRLILSFYCWMYDAPACESSDGLSSRVGPGFWSDAIANARTALARFSGSRHARPYLRVERVRGRRAGVRCFARCVPRGLLGGIQEPFPVSTGGILQGENMSRGFGKPC